MTRRALDLLGTRRNDAYEAALAALNPHRLERLGRYEVHLRKLERMLAMLMRLQELRRVAPAA